MKSLLLGTFLLASAFAQHSSAHNTQSDKDHIVSLNLLKKGIKVPDNYKEKSILSSGKVASLKNSLEIKPDHHQAVDNALFNLAAGAKSAKITSTQVKTAQSSEKQGGQVTLEKKNLKVQPLIATTHETKKTDLGHAQISNMMAKIDHDFVTPKTTEAVVQPMGISNMMQEIEAPVHQPMGISNMMQEIEAPVQKPMGISNMMHKIEAPVHQPMGISNMMQEIEAPVQKPMGISNMMQKIEAPVHQPMGISDMMMPLDEGFAVPQSGISTLDLPVSGISNMMISQDESNVPRLLQSEDQVNAANLLYEEPIIPQNFEFKEPISIRNAMAPIEESGHEEFFDEPLHQETLDILNRYREAAREARAREANARETQIVSGSDASLPVQIQAADLSLSEGADNILEDQSHGLRWNA